ncbi:AraC family transcriptional regulator [Anabaena sp. UHCC 0399]|uniref:helix-turn-helix domain-containing protein n=1 Tax=Anabaena sp. UHCC 0399 TaxID=3110238 RepID=UPI002B2188D0|nr:AraC family transcriptional regulator [Anabaena sp. UHCC 0399]MEA5568181.1 AraC family transcriptional regulator [Anabaena sp. UHCC 0399]
MQTLLGLHRTSTELELKVQELLAELSAVNEQLCCEEDLHQRTQTEIEKSFSILQATLEATAEGIIAIRFLTSCTDTATSSIPNSILPSVPKLKIVFDFIEANYHQPITLYDVAQAAGYSPTYLTNLVRCQTGQTVYKWIVQRRMAQAHSLLVNTDQPVNQIAAAVGYPDPGHFIRQFRKIHSTTPKMWRNMHRS